jgi:hypothetical protein
MTAVVKPGHRVGGGTPNCHVRERVFEEGGTTWAAAVATCTQVLMRLFGLVGVTALRSHVSCRLRWRFHLDGSAANVVGLLLGLMMVATKGALMGLTVGVSVGTLGIGACGYMEWVICLLSLVWGMRTLGGACTIGTCCVLQILSRVMVSSNLWGFVCT